MYSASQTAELTLELFHFQTNTSLQFPANLSVICIGKPNDQKPPDIDVSGLCGYQLFTTGKVFNLNLLTLQITKK